MNNAPNESSCVYHSHGTPPQGAVSLPLASLPQKAATEQLCDLDEHGDEGSKGCSHYRIGEMWKEVPLEEHLWSAACHSAACPVGHSYSTKLSSSRGHRWVQECDYVERKNCHNNPRLGFGVEHPSRSPGTIPRLGTWWGCPRGAPSTRLDAVGQEVLLAGLSPGAEYSVNSSRTGGRRGSGIRG